MRRQRGVTMIGWIILLVPMALTLYAALRIGPIYYEYYKQVSAVETTASELRSDETLTAKTIRDSIQRRFDTSYVDDVDVNDLEVTKGEAGWSVRIQYDAEAPLFANLLILLRFDKTVAFY